ncbi:hypothetical protein SAMN06295909_2514 [Plantibacter sp. VKM Ac-1784]|uniref:ABC transporter permease n=1 Tax=Plantibacter elymi (nom. nud.) TaxID=199708 RepID=A0ABY1RDZ7_9MICO|nr:hypothetical protein [Plantibacter sp. VKM Ac-1784]SMQ71262.1 hypothetical protein SAMN06295909_2514 [Plantibacter sp. VKM Ac-1784]
MSTKTPSTRPDGNGRDPLQMPENHLDMVVTPDSVEPSREASLRTRVIAVVSMPLFFLLAFTLCYVSATHSPVPHDLAVTISGPAELTAKLADTIADKAENAFTVTETTNADKARDAVLEREAVGAVIIDGTAVTTIVASGGGAIAAPAVRQLGAKIATQLGGTATVEDVAPLPADDPSGTVLFYFLIVCTVGGFLSVTVISQAIPKVRARAMLATSAGAALIVPALGFSMISVWVDFEATFGSVAAVIGIGMIYTLTVGLIATLLTLVLGQGAVLAEILILVALNFPSAGASVPESMLPPFWQVIHNGWLGSGAFESMRSIMFFDGNQTGRWLAQLLIWTATAIVLVTLSAIMHRRRAAASARRETDVEPLGASRSPQPQPGTAEHAAVSAASVT